MKNINTAGKKKDIIISVKEVPAKENYTMNTSMTGRISSVRLGNISADQLQEAIIWSEILGKPKGRQRKRRTYGY